MLAINGETGPPCGVPFVRVSRVPSGISIGAFSQRSTYSRTHFESVWHATAFSIRSHGTESKKALTSRSTIQSLFQHRSRHTFTASNGERPDGSRKSRRGKLSPRWAPTPPPPPIAPPCRPRWVFRGPWSHLSWVSPPLGPDHGNRYPTTFGYTVCRQGPSISPRTARSSRRRPRPLRRSSSPSATHPTPAAWGCHTTCPATSAHSCDSIPFG